MEITTRPITHADKHEWLLMRKALWPHASDADMSFDQNQILVGERDAVFFAYADGNLAGMLEARLRDYGEGCTSSPIGYIEAWFVYEPFRGKGVAGALTQAAENWARGKGCTEMASDTWLDNAVSIRAHEKLGYQEVERLVHFVKKL